MTAVFQAGLQAPRVSTPPDFSGPVSWAQVPTAAPKQQFVDSTNMYELYAEETREKQATGNWVAAEIKGVVNKFNLNAARDQTFRLYESGLGNGVALFGLVRAVHNQAPELPITVAAKEFEPEHLAHTLENFADIFEQQKDFSFAVTNGISSNAPTLRVDPQSPKPIHVKEVKLKAGITAEEFKAEIKNLAPWIQDAWKTTTNAAGAPVSANQAVLVISREDRSEALEPVPHINDNRPIHAGTVMHAWRLAATPETKAKILAPIANQLAPNVGKIFVIQASNGVAAGELNTGTALVERVLPEVAAPLAQGWGPIIGATQKQLTAALGNYDFETGPDIELTTGQIDGKTALALAFYAAQAPADKAERAKNDGAEIVAEEILTRNGGALRFNNETLVVSYARHLN